MVATCGLHLLVEQRVLSYPEFVTFVTEDLAELRDDGFALNACPGHSSAVVWTASAGLRRRGRELSRPTRQIVVK